MKNVVWDVHCVSPPAVARYCKKCGNKTEYVSSGQFRVNAQRKYLDIWLIYKCTKCDTTWKDTVYSRINPKSISGQLLECFYNNNEMLSREYAMNAELLKRNGAEFIAPGFEIVGKDFMVTESVKLQIKSEYGFPIKLAIVLKNKLKLSQSELFRLIDEGRIISIPNQDLRKLKLNKGVTLLFKNPDPLVCRKEKDSHAKNENPQRTKKTGKAD